MPWAASSFSLMAMSVLTFIGINDGFQFCSYSEFLGPEYLLPMAFASFPLVMGTLLLLPFFKRKEIKSKYFTIFLMFLLSTLFLLLAGIFNPNEGLRICDPVF